MRNLATVMTEKFISADPAQAAKALEGLATHEIILLVGSLKAHTLVSCLNEMSPAKAAAVLRRLPLKQACYVLNHLGVPQAVKLWKEFSTPYQERLRTVLDKSFVDLLVQGDQYPEDSVAHLLNTDFVAVSTETKIHVLIERLKNLPRKKLPSVCFITGKNGEWKGVIRTAEMAFFSKEAVCGSVMGPAQVLHLNDKVETARKVFMQVGAEALPVVNESGLLMGFVEERQLPREEKPFWKRFGK